MGFINHSLRRLFKFIGFHIAKYPKTVATLSVILSLGLGTGMYINFSYISNVELLYTHSNGESKIEREQVEKYFLPKNHETFSFSRMVRVGRAARIIITSKDNGTVLRTKIWNEILELDKLVHNTRVEWNNASYQYENICGRFRSHCYENEFLDLGLIMDSIEEGSFRLSYPVMFNPQTFNSHLLSQHFGGNKLSNDSFSLVASQAVILSYILAVDNNDEDDSRGEAWELKILEVLEQSLNNWKEIDIYRMTIKSLSEEQEANTFSTIPYFALTMFLMGVFAFITTLSTDCVRTKSWVSQVGILSAGLGTLAGCGILSFIGISHISLNLAVPFIMIGIGIDDTFIMLSSWKKTSVLDSVPDRLAKCYEDVAVSITITSVTDMLSFYVGLLTPIQSVQIFCAYAGTCVICIFFWHVFFFGSIMAISGYQEKKNKNSIFCWKTAKPKSLSENRSSVYKIFFTGGTSKCDPTNDKDHSESAIMIFFRDSFVPMLNKPLTKIFIILLYVMYLWISYWGISSLKEGLERENLIRTDSYLSDFIHKENEYFTEFQYRMQIIVTTPLPLDYSQKENQEKINNLLQEYYNLDHIVKDYSENWLKDFITYVNNYNEFSNFNISTEQQFIGTLESEYLNSTRSPVALDVKLNENKTKILATRYIIQSTALRGSNDERDLVVKMREIAEEQGVILGLDITVYNPWYHFIDQFIIIKELASKSLGIAAFIVMFVTTLFLSNFISSFLVFFSTVSIEVGLIGIASLWGVKLDLIAVLFLLMTVGQVVDFPTHIAYAYISANDKSSLERLEDAMYSVGYPIVQASISTLIGVALLIFIPSYIFHTMFKIVVLSVTLAAFHALFLLPVLLLVLKPENWEFSKISSFIYGGRKKKLEIFKMS